MDAGARGPRRSGWAVLRLAVLVVAGVASTGTAYAVPTPDVVVGIINLLPLLTGAGVTAAGAVYLILRRLLGHRAGDFVAGASLGFLVLAGTLTFLAVTSWSARKEAQRARDLALYLRCDFESHVTYGYGPRRGQKRRSKSTKLPLKYVSMSALDDMLREQPDAALIACYRTAAEYESGIPAVSIGDRLVPFEYVRRGELAEYLTNLTVRDVYLIDVHHDLYWSDDRRFKKMKTALEGFDHAYRVRGVRRRHRYVRTAQGSLRRAVQEKGVVAWPVREESWIIEDTAVAFPGIVTFVGDAEVAERLHDGKTIFIAPYDGALRMPSTYKWFLKRFFKGVDRDRVFRLDLTGRKVTARLNELATTVDGTPFLIVGVSKWDYVYSGIDTAFSLWDRLGRDPSRFQFLGFTANMPEAVALSWVWRADRRAGGLLAGPFWDAFRPVRKRLGLTRGAALLAFAIGFSSFRLAFWSRGHGCSERGCAGR